MPLSAESILAKLPITYCAIDKHGLVSHSNIPSLQAGSHIDASFETAIRKKAMLLVENALKLGLYGELNYHQSGSGRLTYLTVAPTVYGALVSFFDTGIQPIQPTPEIQTDFGENYPETFYGPILDSLPDYVFVFDRQGKFVYVNSSMRRLYGYDLDVIGKGLLEIGYPDELATLLNGYISDVFTTGKAVSDEVYYTSRTGFSAYFDFIYSPVLGRDNKVAYVAGVSRDTTSRKLTEQKLAESRARLSAVLEILPAGIAITDKDGEFLFSNTEMDRFVPRRIMPSTDDTRLSDWQAFDTLGKPLPRSEFPGARALRGEHVKPGIDMLYTHPAGNRIWTKVSAIPLIDDRGLVNGQVTLVHDVSELKDTIRAAFDSVTEMIQVFKALRDDDGRIIDFIWVLNNASSEKIYGDVIGKRLLENNPGVVKAGIFDHFIEVVESGRAVQYEKNYVSEMFDGWFHQSVVKLGDGVATTTTDITSRKKTEVQMQRNLMLLNRAESIGKSGSWEYDPASGIFHWSAGMYHLFGITPGSSVTEDILLEKATKGSKKKLVEIIRALRKGNEDIDTVIEFNINGKPIAHQLTAYPVTNLKGQHQNSSAIMGINIDISKKLELEQNNRRLVRERYELKEKQRLDLLTSILDVQEEERSRLADSLHNGLSQTLYGMLFTLKALSLAHGTDNFQEITSQLASLKEMLANAISEARRISHELTPNILQLFGLRAAIEKMCTTYEPSFSITRTFENLPAKSQPYLEMVIYRTIQELLLNAVRHAGAKSIAIRLEYAANRFDIRVSDDGNGFADGAKTSGIGLATIRQRLKLLNGSLSISSSKGNTVVKVSIPDKPRSREKS
ncbi:PAS domain S-box protein [Pedobacter sp. GSP4]|uniref:sensor histidine kinase n=1 Tax=Pedobacter sp. GSP4 TaxID=3453716 RepID=UPI003EEA5FF1